MKREVRSGVAVQGLFLLFGIMVACFFPFFALFLKDRGLDERDIGLVVSVSGVVTSFYANTPSGGTIVLMAIAAFTVVACATALRTRVMRARRTVVPAMGASGSADAR